MNCNEFQLKVTVGMTIDWSIDDEVIVEPYGSNYKVKGSGTLTTYPTTFTLSRRSRWCNKTQPYRYDHLCNRFWLQNLPIFNRETDQYAEISYSGGYTYTERMDARFYGNFGMVGGMPDGPEPWNKDDPFYKKAKTLWDNRRYGPSNFNALPFLEVATDYAYVRSGVFNGYKSGAVMTSFGTTATMTVTIVDEFPA